MANQPRKNNPHRSVRIEDDLWRQAGEVCAELGTTRAAVMQEALRGLVAGHDCPTCGHPSSSQAHAEAGCA